MVAAASAVYAANPDVLIFLSGLESDFNIEPAVAGSTLLDPSFSFEVSDYTWKNQLVFEMHEYAEPGISDVCLIYQGILERFGFNAVTEEGGNRAPLVISEWGYAEDDASAAYQSVYATCLAGYMVEKSLGFMLWTLAGSCEFSTQISFIALISRDRILLFKRRLSLIISDETNPNLADYIRSGVQGSNETYGMSFFTT
jgi:hypothetical protein